MHRFWPVVVELLKAIDGRRVCDLERERPPLSLSQEPHADTRADLPALADPRERQRVDVIVTVFGALECVRRCLESLRRHTDGFDLRIIVVDDGSEPATVACLEEISESWPELRLLRHDRNYGYTRAVNSGLRVASAGWVVLLNSDTVVTEGWLSSMVRCADSDPSLGLVGPLSNAASWQSVPLPLDGGGGFAINELTDGLDADAMARLVAEASQRSYPRLPILNGFCVLLRRAVLERVGLMDERLFPIGYGEENDYCLRASDAGFALAVADDAYVFHEKSKSFGGERRAELSRRGAAALVTKYGTARVEALSRELESHVELGAVRRRIADALEQRLDARRLEDPLGLRILFLLPVLGPSGGANSVIQEAAEMASLGVRVKVAVPPERLGDLAAAYEEVAGIRELLVAAPPPDLIEMSKDFDVVVASVYYTMEWAFRIVQGNPAILPAYYVQDYEPSFFLDGSPEQAAARASYERVDGALLFAKTQWLIRTLAERHGVRAEKVDASLDHTTFYPIARDVAGPVRITAMVRPQTPRRAAARTMRVLRELAVRCGDRVQIHVFGCDASDPRFVPLVRDFAFENHGVLRRPHVAQLLRHSDIFVDLSDYQAFGRTALEAMASGCVPVVPRAGGGDEFAVHLENSLSVDTNDERACLEAVAGLVAQSGQLQRMRQAALAAASRFSVRGAARSELEVLARAARQWRSAQPLVARKHLALVSLEPSQRSSWNGLEFGWTSASVHREWRVARVGHLPNPGTAEIAVLIVNPLRSSWVELAAWLRQWRAAGGRLVVQLDLAEVLATGRIGNAPFDAKVNTALRWLGSVADAVCVHSELLARRLHELGVAAVVVPPTLDPIAWQLGAAGRRPAPQNKEAGRVVIGLTKGPAPPELLRAIEELQAEGHAAAFQTLDTKESSPLFEKLRPPRHLSGAELPDWLISHVRWDIALNPAPECCSVEPNQPMAPQVLAALGAVTIAAGRHAFIEPGSTGLSIENEKAAWRSAIASLLNEPSDRERLARAARLALDNELMAADRERAAASVLDAAMRAPARADVLHLPRPLQGLTGGLLRFRKERYISVQRTDVDFPNPRSKLRRKLDKLRRDPARFFGDSKLPPLRLLKSWFT